MEPMFLPGVPAAEYEPIVCAVRAVRDGGSRCWHRAGEGAPFTGLKQAGRDLGPAIPAADKALDTGSVQPLVELFTRTISERLRDHFDEVRAAKMFATNDVIAGREYVRLYVAFIHYVERLYETSGSVAHGHYESEHPPSVP